MLHERPDDSSPASSQLLRGETFAVIDIAGGWAWGYGEHDGYVGYVREKVLGRMEAPSHYVCAPWALVFAKPDIKSAVVDRWPIGATLTGEEADGFIACAAGYVHVRHARAVNDREEDPVSVAERLIGMPYLWGGRGGGGIDCSGLVQMALGLCGIGAPRDTDLQRAGLGEEIAAGAQLRRGDLIYMPGHVGMMVDAERMVHANAYWMAVTIEPLTDVVARVAKDHAEPIVARRRIVE